MLPLRVRRLICSLYCLLLGLTLVVAIIPAQAGTKQLELKVTTGFKIESYNNNIKKVSDGAGRQLLLVTRGTKVPPRDQKLPVIYTPLRKVIYASVTQACLLRPFNDRSIWKSIVGVTIPQDQWYIPEIKTGLKNGGISYVGDSFTPDFELIKSLNPDLVMVYGGPSGQYKLIQMLKELQIPYAVNNDYLENDPLGRLEWIKFIGAFYNKETEATTYFEQVSKRIDRLKNQIKQQRAVKPKVAWGMSYNGKVYVPGDQSFAAKMIELAGGEFVFNRVISGVSSLEIGLEEFYLKAQVADILILAVYPNQAPSIAAIVKETPLFKELKAVATNKVWCLQPWYNQLLDKPDELIADLAVIFGTIKQSPSGLRHFKPVPPR
jgi:iron complex transport system substrate-binding protein